jgi:hypothetical protein
MNAIFQRLKFAIQNGLLTQLVVSLPFIHVINTLNLIENIRDFFFDMKIVETFFFDGKIVET